MDFKESSQPVPLKFSRVGPRARGDLRRQEIGAREVFSLGLGKLLVPGLALVAVDADNDARSDEKKRQKHVAGQYYPDTSAGWLTETYIDFSLGDAVS